MLALRYIGERMRDLQSIVSDGAAAGVIGDVKVREAVVDRQFVPHHKAQQSVAPAPGAQEGQKTHKAKTAKTAGGGNKVGGDSSDVSGLLNPGAQAPLE